MLTDFFGRFGRDARKPRDFDAIALQLFGEISRRKEERDPTSFIKTLTEIGARDRGRITSIEQAQDLVDTLHSLPLRQRAIVELTHNEWEPAQIAAVLCVSKEVVIREHARAMGELRAKGML